MNRLLQYLRVILKWRRLIFLNALVLTVVAVGISFVLPRRFTATARLLPPPEEDALGLSSILGGGLGSSRLGRLRAGLFGGSTPSDLMVGILASRTVRECVVDRCSIIDYYRIRRRSKEAAVKLLSKMTGLSATDDGIVSISAEAKTPALAANIANVYVEELDLFLRTSNISRGRNMRLFIERRLGEVESTFALAQESLESFQQRHKTVALDEESKAAVEVYAKLKSQLYLRQAELTAIEGVSGPGNPYVTSLQGEIDAFREQIARMERTSAKGGFGVGFGVAFEDLPAVAAEFLRRYRDYKIQEEAHALLYQQYEYAKILEARDTPALTVLDHAVPPERRSFPRRWVIAVSALVFGTVAGLAFAFISEYFQDVRSTRPEEYRGWQEAGRQLGALFRRVRKLFSRKNK